MEHDADVFSREPNGLIALRITQDEWDELIHALGYIGEASIRNEDAPFFNRMLRLVNRLNAGNPDWVPYVIPEEVISGEVHP